MSGIYIHIPFCPQKCIYCDFYSVRMSESLAGEYFAALGKEAELRMAGYFPSNEHAGLPGAACSGTNDSKATDDEGYPQTLYFGGGTPSCIGIGHYERFLGKLGKITCLDHVKEFTFEANPDDITEDYAKGLRKIGAGRISMGVQSFIDHDLKWMNRRHSSEQACSAYRILRKAGFANISLDLIFGYSGLSMEKWKYDLEMLVRLGPEHVSAYQMSTEPGSMLASLIRKGRYAELADEECERQYAYMQEFLKEAGYVQYEISNFAKPGYEAVHNSSYWNSEKYLGLGPGAHSYDGKSVREWNTPDIGFYIGSLLDGKSGMAENDHGIAHGSGPCAEAKAFRTEREILSEKDMFNEHIMVGLRKSSGIRIKDLQSAFPAFFPRFENTAARLAGKGDIVEENGTMRIPHSKFFISDSIIAELFAD